MSEKKENSNSGKLTLVAGPIGNLGDLSDRARQTLAEADYVIAEDSRITGKLLAKLELKKEMLVLNEHTRPDKIQSLADQIQSGNEHYALLADAGTPSISDPGAILVDILHNQNAKVDCLPGPSAVTTSLALSGFFAQQFAFLGFPPRKPGPMRELLTPFAYSTMTLVFFESPYRFNKTLDLCFQTLGPRRYAICRELTKLHQQVYREFLPKTPSESTVPAKGEFTIVVEGWRRPENS